MAETFEAIARLIRREANRDFSLTESRFDVALDQSMLPLFLETFKRNTINPEKMRISVF